MKKLLFAVCITVLSALVVAGPVDSFGFGYSDVSISSADALIGIGKSEVAVADPAPAITDTESNPKISYKILPVNDTYKTGVGLIEINSQSLSYPRNQIQLSISGYRHSNLLHEVGWLSGA